MVPPCSESPANPENRAAKNQHNAHLWVAAANANDPDEETDATKCLESLVPLAGLFDDLRLLINGLWLWLWNVRGCDLECNRVATLRT